MSKEILLLGEFSTGKSAFINMLLGVSILPERLDATDMPVVKIWQSKPTGLFLREIGQKNPLTLDFFSDIPRNWDIFEYAEISIQDHPLLKQGLILWDTPGINSTNPNHQAHLEKFLKTSMRDFELIIFFFRRNLTSTHLEFLKKYPQLKDKIKFVLNIHENESNENADLLLNEAKNEIRKNGFNNKVVLLSIGDLVDEFNIESQKKREGLNDWDLIKEWSKRKIELNSFNNRLNKDFVETPIFEEITAIATKEIKGRDYYLNLDLDTLAKLSYQGDAKAMFRHSLMLMYIEGNLTKALELLTKSANLGNEDAQYELASLYKTGIFIDKNDKLYYHYINLAVQNNSIEANAESYLEGINRPKDAAIAFKILKNEIDKENFNVANRLAECYVEGEGVESNLELAEKYYRIYAEYEKIAGADELALFLLECQDIKKNKEGISILNKLISDRGSFFASLMLSANYIEGNPNLRIKSDTKLAYELLKPFQGKNYLADTYLARIYLEGDDKIKNEKLGLKLLVDGYNGGFKEAGQYLAECYSEGIGTAKDIIKAEEILQKLIAGGFSEAKYNLGRLYLNDETKKSSGYSLIEQSAIEGNENSINFLVGFNEESNPEVALNWLEKNKNIDKGLEIYLQAKVIENNIQKEGDYARAFEHYNKAADMGHSDSINKVGIYFLNGWGVEENHRRAFEFFQIAAQKELPIGYNNLGYCYQNGFGVNKNIKEAIKNYEIASSKGISSALTQIGIIYLTGDTIQVNNTKAFNYFQQAAQTGDDEAQNYLGRCYTQGWGTKISYTNATEWFEKSADQGNSVALYNLALAYFNGNGVKKDLYTSFSLMTKSAELGYSDAQHWVGQCFENGVGVTQNVSEAFRWYDLAIQNGCDEAIESINELNRKYKLR